MATVRLNKRLKDMGIASRRKSEEFIRLGMVYVNGALVKDPAFSVDEDIDTITFSEELSGLTGGYRYIAYYKPAGVTSTFSDKEGRGLNESLGGTAEGLSYAGRLDKDSEGLMILSDDGKFIYDIMSPESKKEKEYIVSVREDVYEGALKKLRAGVKIEGSLAKAVRVVKIDEHTFKIIITEGKNREVRKMASKVGFLFADS